MRLFNKARWQSTGRIDAILEALQLHLNEEGLISTSIFGALTTPMSGYPKMLPERVKNTPVNQVLGRSRGGFGCKIRLVTMVMVYRRGSAFH